MTDDELIQRAMHRPNVYTPELAHRLYTVQGENERLRAELAALREQKPVAWRRRGDNGEWMYHGEAPAWLHDHLPDLTPLYAAPVPASRDDAMDAERFVFMIENGARIGWFRGKCKVETAIETLSGWFDDPRSARDAAIPAAKGGAK